MTAPVDQRPFRAQLENAIDQSTQQSSGHDIDQLIEDIAETEFERLSDEYESDQLDKSKFKKVKAGLMVTSVVLAIVSVVAAVASIFFSAGTIAAGSLALAAASGMVSITTSFKQLDGSIEKFILYYKSDHLEKTRFNRLKKKISNVSSLIKKRIGDAKNLNEEARTARVQEILDQINKVNEFIGRIKEEVPQKIMHFDVLDPSPLLVYAG